MQTSTNLAPDEIDSLVVHAKAGDRSSFEKLYRLFHKDAYLYALYLIGNKDDAEDIAQTAFVRALRKLPDFELEGSFQGWLSIIIDNLVCDLGRKRTKLKEVSLTEPFSREDGWFTSEYKDRMNQGPYEGFEEFELYKAFRNAIAELPSDARSVVVMYCLQDGYSHKGIAKILGIPVGTVKSRLFYARVFIKEKLGDQVTDGMIPGWSRLEDSREDGLCEQSPPKEYAFNGSPLRGPKKSLFFSTPARKLIKGAKGSMLDYLHELYCTTERNMRSQLLTNFIGRYSGKIPRNFSRRTLINAIYTRTRELKDC